MQSQEDQVEANYIDYIDSNIPELGNRHTVSNGDEDNITVSVPPLVQTPEPEPELEPEPRRGGRDRHLSGKAQSNINQGKTTFGQKTRSVNMVKRMHCVFMNSLHGTIDSQPSNLKDITIPNSYAQAMASPQSDQWLAAMQSEVDSLKANNTWQPVQLIRVLQDANII